MNLNPLYELKERLESSIIAGLALLPEDFRLKRAVEQMEPLSKVNPVFRKIFQDAQALFAKEGASQGDNNQSDRLLDVLALVDAVLTTQAAVGVEGELEVLMPQAAGIEGSLDVPKANAVISNAPYSQLAPLLEALTTAGSGHYSLIVDTHERKPEIFADYRLKAHLVNALNAGYAELAERMEEWLGQEDASLLPLLKEGFDPRGRKEMVRRVHVVEAIAGAAENPWYLAQLDGAEKDVRAALILALRHSTENRETLMGLARTERGNCKKAAMWAMAKMDGDQNLDFWEAQMKKKPDTAAQYLALSTGDDLSDLVADAVAAALDKLQTQLEDGSQVLPDKDYGKLLSLLSAMVGKASDQMLDVYRRLASDTLLGQMEIEKGQPVSHYLAAVLAQSMLWCMDSRLFSLAEELYQAHGGNFLKPALITSLLTQPKEAAFDVFGAPLAREGTAQKENAQQAQARMEVMRTFAGISWNKEKEGYEITQCYQDESKGKQAVVSRLIPQGLDFRWFEVFTNPKLKKDGAFHISKYLQFEGYYGYYADWDQVMANLINPQSRETCAVIGKYFYGRAYTAGKDTRYYPLLRACGYTDVQGLVTRSLKKGKNNFWNLEYMLKEIPLSTEDKLKELDEIKKLAEAKKIAITGWSEEKHQELYTRIAKG